MLALTLTQAFPPFTSVRLRRQVGLLLRVDALLAAMHVLGEVTAWCRMADQLWC